MEQCVLTVCNYVDVIGSYCYTHVTSRVRYTACVIFCNCNVIRKVLHVCMYVVYWWVKSNYGAAGKGVKYRYTLSTLKCSLYILYIK